jgi:hypothetical protein
MGFGEIVGLSDIPYLSKTDLRWRLYGDTLRPAEQIAERFHVPPALAPVMNLIVHGTLAAREDCAQTLAQRFKWHEPTVPE